MPTMVKTRGDYIMVKRFAKRFQPSEIAAKLGVPVSLLIAWENDAETPSSEQWKALVGVLAWPEAVAERLNPT